MKVTAHSSETLPGPRSIDDCPVEAALAVVGGKWKPLLLWHLTTERVRRFGELQRLIPGVTKKMLTQSLRELERDGVVSRRIYAETPPRVEYSLSPYGRTIRPVMRALCHWGLKHRERPGPPSPP